MKYKLIIALFIAVTGLSSCKDDCLKCTGITADRVVCPDDYSKKSDFENEISEYEGAGGVCE